jgi:NarL family two-component system response regulator LiaR
VRGGSAPGSTFAQLPVRARPSVWRPQIAEAIRVLLVDDHRVVREGLRAFLELQEGIEVAGEAADGKEAIEAATRLRPDVILMDLVMPKLDGVAAMRSLRERVPDARVIVLTSFLDDDKLLPALRSGAAGYLLKNTEPQELARAVRAAHAGEALLDPVVAARLVETLAADGDEDPLDRLTPREREVLVLIGRGFPNKRIARELDVSEKTVKTHVGHVLAKLGVTDRTQAAVFAVRAGLVGGAVGRPAKPPDL